MASLDGYSLNEKIDKLRNEVALDLENLRVAYGELYRYVETLGENQDKLMKTKPKGKKDAKKKPTK